MPDLATHYCFGQNVLSHLPEGIRIDRKVFDFALTGPDDWFFCFTRPALCVRGRIMHRRKTGAFLSALASKHDLFSYFAGYFCHYTLDATCHPYIIAHAGSYEFTEESRPFRGNHTALERALDRWILKDDTRKRPLTGGMIAVPLPETLKPSLNAAYQDVYGWQEVFPDLLLAKRKMRRYTWIMEDPYGIARVLTDIVPHPMLQPLPYSRHEYESADILNLSHHPWHHPKDPELVSTSSFPELMEQAQKEAVNAISAVSRGDLSLIGNRSYITGLDLDDERNLAKETYTLLNR